MTIPNIATFDHGTFDLRIFFSESWNLKPPTTSFFHSWPGLMTQIEVTFSPLKRSLKIKSPKGKTRKNLVVLLFFFVMLFLCVSLSKVAFPNSCCKDGQMRSMQMLGPENGYYHGNLRYPPQGHPPPRSKALIFGLIKGNQWLINP